MSFHTAPQFHATISHHTLFFTTPFCTTSHSLVHSGHRHSTSYNVPFHITTYNKYISSIVFKSALKTHLFSCVCVKRVQIALCITLLSSTPHNVFTSHNIPSHNAKRFYITPPFTSHHSTPHHHCTTFHITLLHTNVPRHISDIVLKHISPRTTIFSISEITLHCSLPRHHHFTPPHLKAHVPHHTATVHISRDSTSTTVAHHTHIVQQYSIFHTTAYSTSH